MFSLLSYAHPEVQLLYQVVTLCSPFWTVNCFPDWLHYFTFPSAIHEVSTSSTFSPTLVIVCLKTCIFKTYNVSCFFYSLLNCLLSSDLLSKETPSCQTTLWNNFYTKYTNGIIHLNPIIFKVFYFIPPTSSLPFFLSLIMTVIWLFKIKIPTKVIPTKAIVTCIYMGVRSKIINLAMFIDLSFSLIKDNYVIQFLITAQNPLMNHKIVTGSFK